MAGKCALGFIEVLSWEEFAFVEVVGELQLARVRVPVFDTVENAVNYE